MKKWGRGSDGSLIAALTANAGRPRSTLPETGRSLTQYHAFAGCDAAAYLAAATCTTIFDSSMPNRPVIS